MLGILATLRIVARSLRTRAGRSAPAMARTTLCTPAFTRDPDVHSGTAVFPGTRVPIYILFDYLKDDDGLRQFLDAYPYVSREAATTVIDAAKHTLTDPDDL